jgi:hypothetical protein
MNGPWSVNLRLKEDHATSADNADGAGTHTGGARERVKGGDARGLCLCRLMGCVSLLLDTGVGAGCWAGLD